MVDMNRKKRKVKGFFQGFKSFIAKGNVVDLAVAVIIGGTFGKIVNSLVKDVILPPIALLLGDVQFTELQWVLRSTESVNANGDIVVNAITINYGLFIQTILEFLIIAFCIYTVITLVIRRKQFEEKLAEEDMPTEVLEPVVPVDVQLLTEIRDELKALNKKE